MSVVFAILTAAGVLLLIWQWVCGMRFPLHARSARSCRLPPVTLLKPVRGWDKKTAESLASWLTQEYPAPVQVLIGIDYDDTDAQIGVEHLLAKLPHARVILCQRGFGPHPKVAKLLQLYPCAEHEVIVVSDADVWAPPDFLAQTVPLLQDEEVGMANCFYCLAGISTLPMRWMGLAVNADFWTQVLQSNSIKPQEFALGAVMITRRRELTAIGGFAAYIDYLADDYQLGNRIARLGRRIQLSPVVVECRAEPLTWREAWNHQLRQARTIRACEPIPFFCSVLNNVTLWSLLWLVTAPAPATLGAIGTAALIRCATALHSQMRLCRSRAGSRFFWMVPIKDLLHFAVWVCAFLGDKVVWRGEQFTIRPGGKLERIGASGSPGE